MINVKDVAKGHINELLGKNEKMSEERLSICRECPICINTCLGPMCDHEQWIHPETNETSKYPKEGYVRGCGCRLSAKTTLKDNHCIINKW